MQHYDHLEATVCGAGKTTDGVSITLSMVIKSIRRRLNSKYKLWLTVT